MTLRQHAFYWYNHPFHKKTVIQLLRNLSNGLAEILIQYDHSIITIKQEELKPIGWGV